MKVINISDGFIKNLIKLRLNDRQIGRGSDRMAILYNKSIIIKIPTLTTAKYLTKEDIQYKTDKKIWTPVFAKPEMLLMVKEPQSRKEVKIFNFIPKDLMQLFSANLIRVGNWRGNIITFWEKLEPCIDFPFEQVIFDLENLLQEMEYKLKDCPICVNDIHIDNIGYDKNGNMKFLDLGYWKPNKTKRCRIDWDGFFNLKNECESSWKSDYSTEIEDDL